MDIHAAAREYIAFILRSTTGPKALLVDEETSGYLSLLHTQSEMALEDVYIIDPLDAFAQREALMEFTCLTYVRPTQRNVALLCKELRNPCFAAYYIYFTGPISRREVELLAESDEKALVKDVRELFTDFYALKPNLFTLRTHASSSGTRVADGIVSALAALRHFPTTIRYQRNSAQCARLASGLNNAILSNSDIFKGSGSEKTISLPRCSVLLIDRSEDPCTPLLTPWTYESMIHEFLTMDLNAVILDKSQHGRSTKKPEENEFVFSPCHDAFYRDHINSDWGTLCVEAQKMVEGYQAAVDEKTPQGASEAAGMGDLRERISRIPAMQRQAANVTKHVEVMAQIGDELRTRDLFAIGAFEQDLMRTHSPRDHWRTFCEIVEKYTGSNSLDITRLALLFILRYENEDAGSLTGGKSGFAKNALYTLGGGSPSAVQTLKDASTASIVLDLLKAHGLNSDLPAERVSRFLDRYGLAARSMNALSGNSENIFKTVIGVVKSVGEQEKSIYTQYESFITTIAKMAAEGSLPNEHFPAIAVEHQLATKSARNVQEHYDMLIFVVGGVTYTEAKAIAMQSGEPTRKASGIKTPFEFLSMGDSKSSQKKSRSSIRVVLGSTGVLTAKTFLEQC